VHSISVLSIYSICGKSRGVVPQVAAIAESMVGREPFTLVQVLSAHAMCLTSCSQGPAGWPAAVVDQSYTLQGPPGTGKTSSTIGIISALLAKAAPGDLYHDPAASLDADMPALQVLLTGL
jgi:hypothetical protein